MPAFDEDGDAQLPVFNEHGTAAAIGGRGHGAALCRHTQTIVRIVSQTATRGRLYSLCHGGNVVDRKV